MLTDTEKVIYYAQAYLFIVKEATAGQIAGFLLQAPFKFKTGGFTTHEIAGILSGSSLFDVCEYKTGINLYKNKQL